jgi:hypothetical protein
VCQIRAAVKLNATITLVNGDYLTSDMCFLLLGYMADQVAKQPVTLLAAMPTLAIAIVNQTKVSLENSGQFTHPYSMTYSDN